MRETRIIQLNAQRSRDELQATRKRSKKPRSALTNWEELDNASKLVRHDQLTGVLNRRGLEEAFEKESSRAKRRKHRCIGLLDIDNFKKLNDSLGHDAGDAALIHLATVIRGNNAPAGYLCPVRRRRIHHPHCLTPLDDTQKALVRLQRELTKRFFPQQRKTTHHIQCRLPNFGATTTRQA